MSAEPAEPSPPPPAFYGAVDAGGTKFLCAIGRSHLEIDRIASIATRSRDETLDAVAGFFAEWLAQGNSLEAIGISSFGPLNRDPRAPNYGRLSNSPKPGWEHADIAGALRRQLHVPIAIDTDVNGAALAEGRWGAARGMTHFAYVTVGTGIGVGIVADGRLLNGASHPELGHYRPPRHPQDAFAGICPFHGDCLEGLASGPAIACRYGDGRTAEELADDDRIWPIVAHCLAHLCTILLFALSPECIVLGGGVMQRAQLLAMIRGETRKMLGGYLSHPLYAGDLDDVIVPSGLVIAQSEGMAVNAGVVGGFILAEEAARQHAG
jgi:fructokinase